MKTRDMDIEEFKEFYHEYHKKSKYSNRRKMTHDIYASDGEWVGVIKGVFYPKSEFVK